MVNSRLKRNSVLMVIAVMITLMLSNIVTVRADSETKSDSTSKSDYSITINADTDKVIVKTNKKGNKVKSVKVVIGGKAKTLKKNADYICEIKKGIYTITFIGKYSGVYSNKELTVRFDSTGGSGINSQKVFFGRHIQKPKDPARNLYSFEGWFTEPELKNIFDFNETATKDITLYAKWKLSADTSELYKETISDRIPNENDAVLLADVEKHKLEILNAATDISFSGTAYYVSNSGKDENDGKSPDTAWATLAKVNEARNDGTLEYGDAVLFERGGLWRGHLMCAWGVTYSAYGEGEKPRIYGSSENGTGSKKWKLYYENDGVKIWKFYHDITEVSNVVFNGGEEFAPRIDAFFNGQKWVVSMEDHADFIVENALVDDMTCAHIFPCDEARYKKEMEEWGAADTLRMDTSGTLYLRCDRGNPGKLFQDIEFQTDCFFGELHNSLVTLYGSNVVDNLCIKYGLMNGIVSYMTDPGDLHDKDHNVIRNCEIGWVGGCYRYLNNYDWGAMDCGETMVITSSHNVVRNNYLYQAHDGGIVSEILQSEFDWYAPDTPCSQDNFFEGNIVEKAQTLVFMLPWVNGGKYVQFKDFVFKNNYFLYAGYNWSMDPRVFDNTKNPVHVNFDERQICRTICLSDYSGSFSNIVFEGNVFYLTKNSERMIVTTFDGIKPDIVKFNANTYVENDNRHILNYEATEWRNSAKDIKKAIKENLFDKKAIVFENSK